MELSGRIVLITGASQGLGVTIAHRFLSEGASVIIAARSEGPLEKVAAELLQGCSPGQGVLAVPCDVSDTASVDTMKTKVLERFGRVDVLVNNASIFGPMGSLESASWQEWIATLNVNFLGTVYVCRSFIPLLKLSDRGKIVNVSGGGAARPLPSLCAYGASKAAVLRFTEELAEELRPFGIDVNSIAPGPLNTRFVDEAIAAGPERLGTALYNEILGIRESGGTPFELGAGLCAYLGSRHSDGITGKSISARYDDWASFHERLDVLNGSELYTMRRIDPSTIRRLRDLLP